MTRIVDRYIAKNILFAILLVTLMLTGLQVFMLFVAELKSIGQGDYHMLQAFIYVLLQTPYQVYLFFPVACLLGALLGLGVMANHRELLVMRASGFSIWQVVKVVIQVAFILVLVVCFLGETVVPKLIRYSEDLKNDYISQGQALRTGKGIWLRSKKSFIHIGHAFSSKQLAKINEYEFGKDNRLRLARKIALANYKDNKWYLSKVDETQFIYKDKVKTVHRDKMIWDVNVPTEMIFVSSKEPDEMTLKELAKYIRLQKESHLASEAFEMSFWRRIFQPITTSVMMLLAIPFIFSELRQTTMGQRFLVGASIGFGFHVLNEFSVPVSQIYQVPPILAASMPTILFALIGLYLTVTRR